MSEYGSVDKQLLMYYVCEYADDRPLPFLAGPYDTEGEAVAASAAYEADHPEFQMKTRVWTCRAGRDDVGRRYDNAQVFTRGESTVPLPVLPSATLLPALSPFAETDR